MRHERLEEVRRDTYLGVESLRSFENPATAGRAASARSKGKGGKERTHHWRFRLPNDR